MAALTIQSIVNEVRTFPQKNFARPKMRLIFLLRITIYLLFDHSPYLAQDQLIEINT